MDTAREGINRLSPEQWSTLLDAIGKRLERSSRPKPVGNSSYDIPMVEPDEQAGFQPFPLTDIQQAYWVGRRGGGFQLGNIAAHGYMEVEVQNASLPRLEQTFNQLIARHPMLRAVVQADGMQRVLQDVPQYVFRHYRLENESADEQHRVLAAVREEMSHQVLDPQVWPLFDVRASSLPGGLLRLHLSIDVLIFDALSFDILSCEWSALYRGESLPPAPRLCYADYVRGLEKLKQTPLHERARRYWRERMADLPPGPDLPYACAPETITQPHFERRTGLLDVRKWANFKRRCADFCVTPSAALLTLYSLVLARWSSRLQFTLNLTLFNRIPFHPDIDRLVGDFTSVIPLAVDMQGALSFADRVTLIQNRLWQDIDQCYVSGVWVARELGELRRNPAAAQFPVVFTSALNPNGNVERQPAAMRWLGEVIYTVTQTPQVWLDHQVTEDEGALIYDWDSVATLFPPGMVDAMFSVYREQLERLSCEDNLWQERELELIPLTQQQLFAKVNDTVAPVPNGLLHEHVFTQCDATPHALALISTEGMVSYAELRRRSNQLAHALWREGMAAGARVAVLLPKSPRQAIAVLGILEAGGAYVPVDSGFSAERITQILDSAQVEHVITLRELASPVPARFKAVCLDELETQSHLLRSLPVLRQPRDAAYIIFTSGSTGTPKGVVIDHRGALNTIVDINRRFSVTARDRVLALSALNFDLSVYDIFGVLAAGGALVYPDPLREREPAYWAELISKHQVTLWNTVPALMDIYATYLKEVAGEQVLSLRLVMMSGDWIPLQLPQTLRTQCPNAKLYSLGGATEASIWSIVYPIDTVDPQWRSIPYGKAMANQSFHVLDSALRPRPVWVPGDLYIGGIGLAQGYWRDPERTGAAFITHPRTGERLYRTGDLGRWLPDGNIEFLGRRDFQVKINGYRVELGEIEVQLCNCPGVRSAVVVAQGAPGEAKRLVAFYVRDGEAKRREEAAKVRLRLSQPGIRRFAEEALRVGLDAAKPCSLPWRSASCRAYQHSVLPLAALAQWLSCLRQSTTDTGRPRARYASAGGLYPVQAYLFIKENRVEGLRGGVYYYHPVDNTLVLLSAGDRLETDWFAKGASEVVGAGALYLLLAVDLDAIEPFYGNDSFHLALLEAGLITQLLEEQAPAADLGMCQIGGIEFSRVQAHLASHARLRFLHGMVAGTPAPITEERPRTADVPNDELQQEREFVATMTARLKATLPHYMVPAAFVRLDELPLSANGKVDRNALPITLSTPPRNAEPLPDSPLAQRIAAVWREVLGITRVGLEDNLFDLGGTSVDMIKIHAALQPQLSQDVTLVDMFFTHPTIGALLRHLQVSEPDKKSTFNVNARRNEALAQQRLRRSRPQAASAAQHAAEVLSQKE